MRIGGHYGGVTGPYNWLLVALDMVFAYLGPLVLAGAGGGGGGEGEGGGGAVGGEVVWKL